MKPQIITTDAGDDLIVLSRAAYEALVAAAEDAQDSLIAAAAVADLAEGRDIAVPLDVAERILDGESRLRVLRKWRGLTQNDLASRAGVAQSAISAIENGTSEGTLTIWRGLATVLEVPLHLLIDPAHASVPS